LLNNKTNLVAYCRSHFVLLFKRAQICRPFINHKPNKEVYFINYQKRKYLYFIGKLKDRFSQGILESVFKAVVLALSFAPQGRRCPAYSLSVFFCCACGSIHVLHAFRVCWGIPHASAPLFAILSWLSTEVGVRQCV